MNAEELTKVIAEFILDEMSCTMERDLDKNGDVILWCGEANRGINASVLARSIVKLGLVEQNSPDMDCAKVARYDPTTQPFDEPLRHVDAQSRINGEYTQSRVAGAPRYLLFVGDDYYPVGGADDLVGGFDTIGEALAAIPKLQGSYDWAQLLDLSTLCQALVVRDKKENRWIVDGKWEPTGKKMQPLRAGGVA